ncbi:MAG: hypothetical protein WA126_04370 [Thermodesulfovibrionales bacterium]
MRLKTVIRNINILNMLLLTVMINLADYSIAPMLETKVNYTLPVAKQHPGAGEEQEEDITLVHLPSVLEYALIGDNNLFHPERKIPQEKKEEQPLPKPEFVLYGTLITNDISLAYIEDMKAPRSSPGRGRRQTALRKGETLAGFTLKEIEHEMIVMVRGEEKMTVPIDDPSHPKHRIAAAVTAAATMQPAEKALTPPLQKDWRRQQPSTIQTNPAFQRKRPNMPRKTTRVPGMQSGPADSNPN